MLVIENIQPLKDLPDRLVIRRFGLTYFQHIFRLSFVNINRIEAKVELSWKANFFIRPSFYLCGRYRRKGSTGGPAHDTASNYPTTGVSYQFPLPYRVPHGRHCSFLSFVNHEVWEEEPPGGKIDLNGGEGDSASRWPRRERLWQAKRGTACSWPV